jgi:HD-like signal output (HDOD) protein
MPHFDAQVELLAYIIQSPVFQAPWLSQIALEAVSMLERSLVGVPDAMLIERNPAHAARFLSAASSPLLGLGESVPSVEAAVSRMSPSATLNLFVYAALEPLYSAHQIFSTELEQLRRHTQATAAACAYLAQRTRIPEQEAASLSGLLHDLGALALLHFIAENETTFPGLVADRKRLGEALCNLHERAGNALAVRWRLAQPLRVAMAVHHDVTPASPDLARLLSAGDALASICGAASGFNEAHTSALEDLLGDPVSVARVTTEFGARLGEA